MEAGSAWGRAGRGFGAAGPRQVLAAARLHPPAAQTAGGRRAAGVEVPGTGTPLCSSPRRSPRGASGGERAAEGGGGGAEPTAGTGAGAAPRPPSARPGAQDGGPACDSVASPSVFLPEASLSSAILVRSPSPGRCRSQTLRGAQAGEGSPSSRGGSPASARGPLRVPPGTEARVLWA